MLTLSDKMAARGLSTRLLPALRAADRLHTGLGHMISRNMCYDVRKVDIMAGKQTFMYDTHAVIQALESQGFTAQQAEVVNECLVQILSANSEHQVKNMVTKAQQEIMMQQVMSHIAAVRKDMIILEKSEFSQLKHEYEKQSIEIAQLKQTLGDELLKMKSSMSLDISLERARSREDHILNEQNLSKLDNRIDINHSETEKMLAKIDNKIDKEVANIIAIYERYKNDTIKYAAGTIMTCLTLCLGFYRLWKV